MHKDEGTKVKAAPTNQSDSGWRARLSWQVDCDGGNGLNRAQGLWMDVFAALSPDIDSTPQILKEKTKELLIIISNSGLL